MKIIIITLFALIIAGCSNKSIQPIVEIKNETKPVPSCMDTVIGSFSYGQWCEILPASLTECKCNTALSSARLADFNSLNKQSLSPAEVKELFGLFPEKTPLSTVTKWAISGLPQNSISYWYGLKLDTKNAVALHRLGDSKRPIIKYLLSKGLDPVNVLAWGKTNFDIDIIDLWLSEGVSANVALDAANIHNLTTATQVRDYLFELRFVPITTAFRKNTWICSKDNAVAQLLSVTNSAVQYVQRFRLIDAKGYELEPFSLFIKQKPLEQIGILTSKIKRGQEHKDNWSECLPTVVSELSTGR